MQVRSPNFGLSFAIEKNPAEQRRAGVRAGKIRYDQGVAPTESASHPRAAFWLLIPLIRQARQQFGDVLILLRSLPTHYLIRVQNVPPADPKTNSAAESKVDPMQIAGRRHAAERYVREGLAERGLDEHCEVLNDQEADYLCDPAIILEARGYPRLEASLTEPEALALLTSHAIGEEAFRLAGQMPPELGSEEDRAARVEALIERASSATPGGSKPGKRPGFTLDDSVSPPNTLKN